MVNNNALHGKIHNTEELGRLVRKHRKHQQLTLENTAGLANLSVRFLSEFERGKGTAEIGKVFKALRTLGLDVIVQPRYPAGSTAPETDDAAITTQADSSPNPSGRQETGND